MLIGLRKTTEKRMVYLHLMEYFLITKVQEEVKLLLLKIISAMCKIKEENKINFFRQYKRKKRLGTWDYCHAMWKILQQNKPDDFVIATGVQYSIKQFVNLTAKN